MLKSLTITNFALIVQMTVNFSSGLTIVTGETGAGKSILMDALNSILGSRTSQESIRTGADFFRVEAVFELPSSHAAQVLLAAQDILTEEDGSIIVSRRLARSGKNTVLVNGCHVTLAFLRQLGELLVDMHGQHENQSLLRMDTHLAFLDAASPVVRAALEQYQPVYTEWHTVTHKLADHQKRARERVQRLDMLTWQTTEIADASLRSGEEEELEQEIRIQANAEKITQSLQTAYNLLHDTGKSSRGVLAELATIRRHLETAARFDSKLDNTLAIVTEALYQLEEAGHDIGNQAEAIEYNPTQLAALQQRMDIIDKLKKKYGATIDEILAYYQQASAELYELNHHEEQLEALQQQKAILEGTLVQRAQALTVARRQAAQEVAAKINEQLTHLGMPKAVFSISLTTAEQYTLQGYDEISLLFSANPGEEAKPLHKVASGGELSRIALAIKTIAAQHEGAATFVFDEIDTGISGQAAQKVAERIAMVAAHKQVLCITHLPQIACMADRHVYIEKMTDGSTTHTTLTVLENDDRLLALAKLTSGADITPIALQNASQMLKQASIKKEKWKKAAQ